MKSPKEFMLFFIFIVLVLMQVNLGSIDMSLKALVDLQSTEQSRGE